MKQLKRFQEQWELEATGGRACTSFILVLDRRNIGALRNSEAVRVWGLATSAAKHGDRATGFGTVGLGLLHPSLSHFSPTPRACEMLAVVIVIVIS